VRTTRIAMIALALALVSTAASPGGVPPMKVTEYGSGPTIVLVHGLGGAGTMWMPTARRLIGTHHVVMVDLPGHAQAPMLEPFSLDDVAEALDGVMAKQPGGAVLVGHGLGGLVAMAELRRHPDHVRGLVLLDAAARSPIPVSDQQQKMFLDYISNNYDSFLRGMFMRLGRDSTQGIEIHAMASQVDKGVMVSYLRAVLTADESKVLTTARVPVLCVGSARAWPDSLAWGDVAKRLGLPEGPNITSRRIANSGYLLMRDQPDSLAAVLDAFTKAAPAPAVADVN
jgi:pimeloyl-ACP methyl ester carboxylesterase